MQFNFIQSANTTKTSRRRHNTTIYLLKGSKLASPLLPYSVLTCLTLLSHYTMTLSFDGVRRSAFELDTQCVFRFKKLRHLTDDLFYLLFFPRLIHGLKSTELIRAVI